MSYVMIEVLREQGVLVELYEFIQGLQWWVFVFGVFEVVWDGVVYKLFSVFCDWVKQLMDIFKNGIKVKFL